MKNTGKNKKTYDQLISNSYGKSTKRPSKNKKKSNFSISKSFDNGEILAQKPGRNFSEYVVQSSIVVGTPFEEYIVIKKSAPSISRQSSVDITTLYSSQKYTAAQEAQTDLNNPLQDDASKLALLDQFNDSYNATATRDTAPAAPTIINNSGATNKVQNSAANPNESNNQANNNQTNILNPGVQLSMDESFRDQGKAAPTDDDFVKDMQAILTGQKVFDPVNKKTVDKSQAIASKAQSESVQLPPMENKHAIFDQIAQSMEYAKAYDLGSIDIDKRFNDFDKIIDIEKKMPARQNEGSHSFGLAEKKNSVQNVATSNSKPDGPLIGNEEFIKDLDIISRAANANKASSATMSVSEQSSGKPAESAQKEHEAIAAEHINPEEKTEELNAKVS